MIKSILRHSIVMLFVASTLFSKTMVEASDRNCSCTCGGPRPKSFRIVGGTNAAPLEFPWIVWIRLGKRNDDFCAGTLVSKSYVVTAAHCLVDIQDLSVIDMFLGIHDVGEARNEYKALNIKYHEEFVDDEDQNLPNDIALIKLNKDVTFDRKKRPACLPTKEFNYNDGQGTVAGWGVTSERGTLANKLRKVLLPFVPIRNCNKTFPGVGERVICAGYDEGGHDACQGDSGGPFHIINDDGFYEVIGLVSFGEGCARPGMPAVFTRISYYTDWIKKNIGGECLCTPDFSTDNNASTTSLARNVESGTNTKSPVTKIVQPGLNITPTTARILTSGPRIQPATAKIIRRREAIICRQGQMSQSNSSSSSVSTQCSVSAIGNGTKIS